MTIFGTALIAIGVTLIVLAGVGLLRFPDVLTRANATTKAAGLGLVCVFAGVAVLFNTPEAWTKMGIVVVLQFLAAPIGGHVIGRAAYRSRTPLWDGTQIDDLDAFIQTEEHQDD